jgi:hypothetical protein
MSRPKCPFLIWRKSGYFSHCTVGRGEFYSSSRIKKTRKNYYFTMSFDNMNFHEASS